MGIKLPPLPVSISYLHVCLYFWLLFITSAEISAEPKWSQFYVVVGILVEGTVVVVGIVC